VLTPIQSAIYDNHRMSKQAISVTLSPDNLIWLKGRARVEGVGSLSEYLDRLLTRTRFGGNAAPPVKSMKGALTAMADEPLDLVPAIPAAVWDAWRANWDDLLTGVDIVPLRRRRG
jgi:hypothetical protein